MKTIPAGKFVAKDREGNLFLKSTSLYQDSKDRWIISLGWPVEYYVESLMRFYPPKHPLTIDIGGRNHLGSEVRLSKTQLKSLLDIITQEIANRC